MEEKDDPFAETELYKEYLRGYQEKRSAPMTKLVLRIKRTLRGNGVMFCQTPLAGMWSLELMVCDMHISQSVVVKVSEKTAYRRANTSKCVSAVRCFIRAGLPHGTIKTFVL
jgi:hypothetical protein